MESLEARRKTWERKEGSGEPKEEELTRASGEEYGTRETNKRPKELPGGWL